MHFNYNIIVKYVGVVWEWLKKIFSNDSGSDSAQTSYSTFLLGFNNHIGDQIVGNNYIHRGDQSDILQQGVDPRDLEKYLTRLDDVGELEDQETQILDWYYAQEIDIALKDTLLLVVSRLPEFVQYEMIFTPENSDDSDLVASRNEQLAGSLKTLADIVAKFKFETLATFIDLELIKLNNSESKTKFLIEAARVYMEIQQNKKALSYLEQAYNIDEDFEILKHVVELYKKIDNYEKIVNLLTPYQNIDSIEDRLFVLINLGLSFNSLGKLNESENVLSSARSLTKYIENPSEKTMEQRLIVGQYLIYAALKKGDVTLAQQRIQESLQVLSGKHQADYAEVLKNDEFSSMFLYIGVLLGLKNEWDLAKRFLNKKLDLLDYDNKPEVILRDFLTLLSNLALISIYSSEISVTEEYLQKLIDLTDRFGIDTLSSQVVITMIKGVVKLKKGDFKQGYIYLDRVFDKISEQSRESSFLRVFVFTHLANIFCDTEDFDKAGFYYSRSLVIINEVLGANSPLSFALSEKINNLRLSNYKILVVI